MTTRPLELPPTLRAGPLDRLLTRRLAVNWEWALYFVIFTAAVVLRFWALGDRALHHDESIHAQWSWSLLQGAYHHSPIFHGPLYYHAEALVFLIFGANDYTARVSAALFGSALVALPLLFRRRLTPVGTAAAMAFIAFSPTIVYYSRFFREDIYLAFFTLLTVVGIWRYLDEGRNRWLFVTAAAWVGSMLTKEGAFITVGIFLVYLDVYLATALAKTTLQARGIDSGLRRLALVPGLALVAWAFAALWPFIGPIKRRMEWDELPRAGDLVILLGTLTLPLLTPLSRVYLLEPLHIVTKDQLSWEKNLQGPIPVRDGVALAGLFAVTTSIAAFAGLQWKPKLWAIAFLSCALVYLTLMTSFWTNLDGLVSGPWGSLDYWITQQNVARGDQPWFYYDMLMPMYEFLPLVLCIGGIWWATVRGDAFSRFLVTWFVGMWLVLSWTSEKMPWNNTHIALPACLLAAWVVNRAWQAWRQPATAAAAAPPAESKADPNSSVGSEIALEPAVPLQRQREPDAFPAVSKVVLLLGSIAVVAGGALGAIAFLPHSGAAFIALNAIIGAAALGIIAYAAWPYGRRALPAVLVATVIGALAFFSFRTMVMASFVRGDIPKDMLIYTQTSPQLANIAHEIDQLAAATGKGHQLTIAVDTTDSFAWPWAWYLRDYKAVSYVDFTSGIPQGSFDVMLVNASNAPRVNDQLAQSASTQYAAPIKYPHRWWFDETYKNAMSTSKGVLCTDLGGNCGPFRLATWKTIANGIAHKDWLGTWFDYWRDHDPHIPPGSVDAYAYFPAAYDVKTGMLSAKPLQAPKPGVDKAGRPMFGGIGPQPGQFFYPTDIDIDAQGNLYVIDKQTRRLSKFDSSGHFIASVDIRTDPKNPAEQSEPWGVAVAPNGDVVVADTFGWRIKVFDAALKPILTFGNAPTQGKPLGPLDLFGPRAVAFDANGNMWVTDTGDGRIQVFTLNGTFVRTIGSKGSAPGQFDEPVGISIASDGTVFVADMYNARVDILNADGSFRSSFPVEGWGGRDVNDKPYIRALTDGRIALSLPALNQVRIYTRSGQLQGTIAPADDPLSHPYGIAETSDGKLWIVEGGSGRVREFPIP